MISLKHYHYFMFPPHSAPIQLKRFIVIINSRRFCADVAAKRVIPQNIEFPFSTTRSPHTYKSILQEI